MTRVLAVAHQTSESTEFIETMADLTVADPATEVVLLVPATPIDHMATWTEGEAHAVAATAAEAARHRLTDAGVNVVDVRIGDARPFEAVRDELIEQRYDKIVVSTFRQGISRWLAMDLIHRLQRTTDTPIVHVVAQR